jgi:DNA repair ATPase RecN
MKTTITYQPIMDSRTITEPTVFNGLCLVRKYRVTIEEVVESNEVISQRLRNIWSERKSLGIQHQSNISAMKREAEKLGIELDY